MATLTNVLPTLVAMGVKALRQQVVMPRLVNREYTMIAGAQKNSTVNVAIPSAITAVSVTPANTPPSTTAIAPTSVPVTLDQWYESPFELSDKDLVQVDRGIIPMQASEAIKALANQIDVYLFGLTKKFGGSSGTPGTTPFATDLTAFTGARKTLNRQLAPMDPRFCVLDVDAEEKAINLRAFQDASFSGTQDVIVNGQIGRKLGALWLMSQNVPSHTAGTITTGLVAKSATAVAAGVKTFVATTAASTGACALLAGDVISIGSHAKTYALAADATQASASTDVTLTLTEGLYTALAGGESITVKGNHVMNLNFHRDAIAFATAPLVDSNIAPNLVAMETIVDPESGLALRLELTREHKRWRWSFDALWGGAVPRPELGARIFG